MDKVVKKSRGRPRKEGCVRIYARVDSEIDKEKQFLEEEMDLNTSELIRYLIHERYKMSKNHE